MKIYMQKRFPVKQEMRSHPLKVLYGMGSGLAPLWGMRYERNQNRKARSEACTEEL